MHPVRNKPAVYRRWRNLSANSASSEGRRREGPRLPFDRVGPVALARSARQAWPARSTRRFCCDTSASLRAPPPGTQRTPPRARRDGEEGASRGRRRVGAAAQTSRSAPSGQSSVSKKKKKSGGGGDHDRPGPTRGSGPRARAQAGRRRARPAHHRPAARRTTMPRVRGSSPATPSRCVARAYPGFHVDLPRAPRRDARRGDGRPQAHDRHRVLTRSSPRARASAQRSSSASSSATAV